MTVLYRRKFQIRLRHVRQLILSPRPLSSIIILHPYHSLRHVQRQVKLGNRQVMSNNNRQVNRTLRGLVVSVLRRTNLTIRSNKHVVRYTTVSLDRHLRARTRTRRQRTNNYTRAGRVLTNAKFNKDSKSKKGRRTIMTIRGAKHNKVSNVVTRRIGHNAGHLRVTGGHVCGKVMIVRRRSTYKVNRATLLRGPVLRTVLRHFTILTPRRTRNLIKRRRIQRLLRRQGINNHPKRCPLRRNHNANGRRRDRR